MALKPNRSNFAQAGLGSTALCGRWSKATGPEEHSAWTLPRDPLRLRSDRLRVDRRKSPRTGRIIFKEAPVTQAEKHLAVLVQGSKDEVWVPA